MVNSKHKNDHDFHNSVTEAYRMNRRIGFSKPQIGIFHCLIEGDGPGFLIQLYDEDSEASVCLYTVSEKDCKNINLSIIAKDLAN
ncbi:hypothetical protein AWM68_20080 [Fictibacillus phosphorivorans]|uniref:Uncharacterized protein n=1 Tax=Fictibacillus phosphorivorans TaxID=1221500 RepID=A0A163RHH1_9BACL|nr:hypothetical protein AWM68_20080 [Fictibacillus phosphorivorans]